MVLLSDFFWGTCQESKQKHRGKFSFITSSTSFIIGKSGKFKSVGVVKTNSQKIILIVLHILLLSWMHVEDCFSCCCSYAILTGLSARHYRLEDMSQIAFSFCSSWAIFPTLASLLLATTLYSNRLGVPLSCPSNLYLLLLVIQCYLNYDITLPINWADLIDTSIKVSRDQNDAGRTQFKRL